MACQGGCSFHSTHIGEDGYGNHYGGMLVEHHFGTVQCYSCESCVLPAVWFYSLSSVTKKKFQNINNNNRKFSFEACLKYWGTGLGVWEVLGFKKKKLFNRILSQLIKQYIVVNNMFRSYKHIKSYPTKKLLYINPYNWGIWFYHNKYKIYTMYTTQFVI